MERVKRTVGTKGWGWENEKVDHRIFRAKLLLYDTIMVSKPIECTTPRMNPNVNWTLGDDDVSV